MKNRSYTYLTAIYNCGWWFVIAVYPDGENEYIATFDNYSDAEWHGMTQPL